MSQPYYNTNDLVGDDLRERINKCKSQEEAIRKFFEAHPDKKFTPFEVQEAVFRDVPITSVRRAITNLTEKNVLRKTRLQRQGKYDNPNHTWTLQEQESRRTLFD